VLGGTNYTVCKAKPMIIEVEKGHQMVCDTGGNVFALPSFTTDYSLEVARPVAGMGPTAGPLRLECLKNPFFFSNGKCSLMPD